VPSEREASRKVRLSVDMHSVDWMHVNDMKRYELCIPGQVHASARNESSSSLQVIDLSACSFHRARSPDNWDEREAIAILRNPISDW